MPACSPTYQRRPRHLLSGLLRCGCCGAGMSTNGKDKSGRIRIRCSAATESGTCPDPKTFYLASVESAVLSGPSSPSCGIPAVIAEYVKAYHEERKRCRRKPIPRIAHRAPPAGTRQGNRPAGRCYRQGSGRSGCPRSEIDGIKRGAQAPTCRSLQAAPATPEVVALHPAVLARYEQQLANLQECLAACVLRATPRQRQAIRDLVQSVTVSRDEVEARRRHRGDHGRLNALLGDKPTRTRSKECGDRW